MQLLTHSNPKMMKSVKFGYMPFILHLAPSTLSGWNVCPASSPECRASCLNLSGRGRFAVSQKARIRKTVLFFEHRDVFIDYLLRDIHEAICQAKRLTLIPCIRLNGTSDIRWETIPVAGKRNVMEVFPDIQFYDYTKLENRKNLPDNYHLTFSLSESNANTAIRVLNSGRNVAVVFHVVPKIFLDTRVIDGDVHDLRFLDPSPCIVGLKAKGKAKQLFTGGFVK